MTSPIFAVLSLVMFAAEVISAYAAPEWCETLLASKSEARDGTDGFIAYLGQLIENQVIRGPELLKLANDLERDILSNPISEDEAQLNSRLMVHHEGLQQQIQHGQIDHGRVLRWVIANLGERERVRVRREETRDGTQDLHKKMDFLRVEPGTFEMGKNGQFVTVTLTEPFEMMSTPVTQKQWSVIMGDNPSRFKDGTQSIVMMINGNAVKIQPDHPVEMVSWNQVQVFIQKLNEQQSAYLYRLPTEAEWEFVARDRGRANGTYSFGDAEADLGEYAWYRGNAGGSTHAVGQKAPLVVDGKSFYDLHGNVWEWVQDWCGQLSYGHKVTNPTGPIAGSHRGLRGGSWSLDALGCRSVVRSGCGPGDCDGAMGFRLVRTSRQ